MSTTDKSALKIAMTQSVGDAKRTAVERDMPLLLAVQRTMNEGIFASVEEILGGDFFFILYLRERDHDCAE